jgi:hypothetical protein
MIGNEQKISMSQHDQTAGSGTLLPFVYVAANIRPPPMFAIAAISASGP